MRYLHERHKLYTFHHSENKNPNNPKVVAVVVVVKVAMAEVVAEVVAEIVMVVVEVEVEAEKDYYKKVVVVREMGVMVMQM